MAKRKREDAATLGDLEDLGEAIKAGFHEAFGKSGKGKTAPQPKANDDDANDDDDDDDDDDDHASPWSLSKAWFGEH
jgi:hypothetical protein